MRVAVTGATGLIGRALARALADRGDTVAALTRDASTFPDTMGGSVEVHEWRDPTGTPPPPESIDGADVVVHLLGEPVAQRWSDSAKRRIRDSRVLSTGQVVNAISELAPARRPATLVSQSAVGYYGARGDEPLDEAAAPGQDFLARVTAEWEAAARTAPVRVVITRTGVVLDHQGGALKQMLTPFRLGLGGPMGGGRQFMPWIHIQDVVGALLYLADQEQASGPVNLTAPEPATNREFSRALGGALHRPALLPVPGAAVRLLFGEMASVVLTGQRAVPARLLELGYRFAFPELEPALRDVLARPTSPA